MPDTKVVTVGEVAAAIRRNGWKQAKGSYVKYGKDGKVESACAIGQGAINLGCTYESLERGLKEIMVFNGGNAPVALDAWIRHQNDSQGTSIGEIGRLMERRIAAIADMAFIVTEAAYKS